MLVFLEQRLVFLATPKTGSTAIEAALESLAEIAIQRPPALKHTPVHRYRRFLEPFLTRPKDAPFTVVALMREPISWLGSWYRYRQRDALSERERSTAGLSFEEFVDAYLANPPPEFARVGSQAKFLTGKEGKGVDRIFRYEEIDAFVDFLEDRLDCEITLPTVNVSPQAATDLSPQGERRLRRRCAADFELYDRVCAG